VASDILGVSGRAMLESLIAGNHDQSAPGSSSRLPLLPMCHYGAGEYLPEGTELLSG
jgi:hypothetical protein